MKNLVILVVVLVLIVIGIVFLGGEREGDVGYSVDEARSLALGFMENSAPTYVFDGFDLELVSEEEVEENTFLFIFEFDSRAAGYGDREEQMLAQVITPHTTEIVVSEGEIVSAITDEVFSELEEVMLEDTGEAQNGESDPTDPIEQTISVFFLEVENGEERVAPVERVVFGPRRVGRAALEELLAGPTAEEQGLGLSTAINSGVEVLDLRIVEGLATADFSSELDHEVAGSARVLAIREQIEQTLLQFPTILEVEILVEGESEEILEP